MHYKKNVASILAAEEAARCLLCYDAPCSKVCPAKTDPAKFIQAIRFKNYKGGIKTIRDNNIFGGICAEGCEAERYCKKVCVRAKIDRAVDIPSLQSFLIDYEQVINFNVYEVKEDRIESVAIYGTDIAALTAAAILRLEGYKVKIYSENESIEKELLDLAKNKELSIELMEKEIKLIKELGVEFEVKNIVKEAFGIDVLQKQEFSAVLVTKEIINDLSEYIKDANYETSIEGVFVSGILSKGPNDIVFSVKKGKEAADKIKKYLMGEEK